MDVSNKVPLAIPRAPDTGPSKAVDQGTVRSHNPQGPQPQQVAQTAIPIHAPIALQKQRQVDSWEHVARSKKSWHSRSRKRGKSFFELDGERVEYDPEEMTELLEAIADDDEVFGADEPPNPAALEKALRDAGVDDKAAHLALLLLVRWATQNFDALARAAAEVARKLAQEDASVQTPSPDDSLPFGTLAEMHQLLLSLGFNDEASAYVLHHAVMGFAAELGDPGSDHITARQLAEGIGEAESKAQDIIRDWNARVHLQEAPRPDCFQISAPPGSDAAEAAPEDQSH